MFLIFFALWLIFNAKFTLEICIFGIVLSALMYLFIWKVFGYKPKYDWLMVKLSLRGIKYFNLGNYQSEYSSIKINFHTKSRSKTEVGLF